MAKLLLSDLRLLARERLAVFALLIGLVCALAAAAFGTQWRAELEGSRAAFVERNTEREAAYRTKIGGAEWTEESSVLAPYEIRLAFAYPTPLLADFSIGRSALEPSMGHVKMGVRADTLFRNYQIDNPDRLRRGRLDLAFVVIVIAPLLLISLGYGVFASDRDSGLARLILAQAGSPLRLIIARSANRLALVALPILLGAGVMLAAGPSDPDRVMAGALWLGAAMVGLLFWWAVVLFVNSLRVSAETAALTLVGLWTLLVFVAPPLVDAAARSAYPPPSRMAQIIDGRVAEQRAKELYAVDHPNARLPKAEKLNILVAEYHQISLAHDRSVRPLIETFAARLTSQQRFVEKLQFGSPPLALANTLSAIAGTDIRRYERFHAEARDHLREHQNAVTREINDPSVFTASDFDAFPRFEPPTQSRANLAGLVWIGLIGALIGMISMIRLRRAVP